MNSNFDQIEANDIYLSIFTENFRDNPRCAAELGFAIMLGKPIYLMVKEGTGVPDTLSRIADGIEYFNETKGSVKAATDRLLSFANEAGDEK